MLVSAGDGARCCTLHETAELSTAVAGARRWVAVTLSTPPSNSSDQAATVQLCEVQVSLTQSPSSEVPGSTSDSNSSSGLSAGAIAGIAVGAAAGLCLLLLLAAYLRWRHRFRGQVPEQQQEAEAAAAKGDVEMSIGDGKAFSSHSPGGGRGGGASAAVLASDAMGDAAGSSINGGSGRLSEGMAAAAAAATSAARLAGRGQSAARHELQLMDEFVRQVRRQHSYWTTGMLFPSSLAVMRRGMRQPWLHSAGAAVRCRALHQH